MLKLASRTTTTSVPEDNWTCFPPAGSSKPESQTSGVF